jgi:hypothetical protein
MSSLIIPDDLAMLFSDPLAYGGVKERIEVYTFADQPNQITPGQISYIRLPKSELSDLRGSTLEFNATCSATSSTYCRFMQPIAGLINRLRVLANSVLLDDELEYGRIYTLKLMSEDNTEWTGGSLSITDGIASTTVRNGYGTNTNIMYQVNLGYISDILNHVLPIGWLGNNQINIEVYWAQPSYVIETDGTAPTYLINNLMYHYSNINVTDNYKKALNERFATGGIQFSFRSYVNYISSFNAATNGTVYTTLPFKKRKALAIIYYATPTANLTSTTTFDKFITFSNYTNYNSSRLKINNTYVPSDRVLNSYELFLQTCDSLDLPQKNNSYIANNWLSGQAFILGQTIAPSPRNVTEDNKIIQGIDISQGNSNTIAEITFSTALSSLETVYYWCEYYAICSIDSNGILSVSD